jgi:hypothetical protein
MERLGSSPQGFHETERETTYYKKFAYLKTQKLMF